MACDCTSSRPSISSIGTWPNSSLPSALSAENAFAFSNPAFSHRSCVAASIHRHCPHPTTCGQFNHRPSHHSPGSYRVAESEKQCTRVSLRARDLLASQGCVQTSPPIKTVLASPGEGEPAVPALLSLCHESSAASPGWQHRQHVQLACVCHCAIAASRLLPGPGQGHARALGTCGRFWLQKIGPACTRAVPTEPLAILAAAWRGEELLVESFRLYRVSKS